MKQQAWIVGGVLLLILMILWSRKSLYDTANNMATLTLSNGMQYMLGTASGPGGNGSRVVVDAVSTQRSTYATPYY
jgi:hypothetical protein